MNSSSYHAGISHQDQVVIKEKKSKSNQNQNQKQGGRKRKRQRRQNSYMGIIRKYIVWGTRNQDQGKNKTVRSGPA